MKIAQKKELAKELFLYSKKTQKEIAEYVAVTPKTMGKWCAEWKKLKAAMTSTKSEIIARYMRMINRIMKEVEDEGRVLNDSEADKISKLNKAMDSINKEIGLAVILQVFQEYNAFILPINAELTKENNKYQDKFIRLKAIGK